MIENKEITANMNTKVFVLSKEVRKMLGIRLEPYVRQKPKVKRKSIFLSAGKQAKKKKSA